MSLAGYAEEFFRPVAKVKINGVGKIVKHRNPDCYPAFVPGLKHPLVNGPNRLTKPG